MVAGAADVPALGCIETVALPVYAGIFWQAQITGTVNVEIAIGHGGAPLDVQVLESPHALLTKWLPDWFKKSVFQSACGGQTIHITLIYRLEGERREAPENQVVIRYPGTFEITAHPPILHPTVD
jgi:hypothetical protein